MTRTAVEGGYPRVDRTSFKGIAPEPKEQVNMEMWNRVSVNLVVHLDRMEEVDQDLGYEECILPESDPIVTEELKGLHHVAPGHDAGMSG